MTKPAKFHETKETDLYLAAFEQFEKAGLGQTQPWLLSIRKAGIARFAELGFPTLQNEDWRYTNVAPIVALPFRPVFVAPRPSTVPALSDYVFGRLDCHRLVFVDGHFAPELSSSEPQSNGVILGSLRQALAAGSAIPEKHLARFARVENNAFAALNTAFFQDGALVYVPSGKEMFKPVHLLFVSTGREIGSVVFARNLVVAERGSSLSLMETYVSASTTPYLTNAVTELYAQEGARVEHCKFQDEALTAFHIALIQLHLARNTNVISHSFATGAALCRNNINATLDGEGVECILNGLYLAKNEQLIDHHMIVEHAKPHCNSHEYYNGILDGRSRGVFHGRILVQPQSQKTDAKQTNKNLLLSDLATANTKPQLEIYADDVKCTHGATIGQLNEESIFYLRARGIGQETARRMLIHAFAGEIIERIRCEAVREELDRLIWDRLEQNPRISHAHEPAKARLVPVGV